MNPIRAGVITISDKGYAGGREDASGPLLVRLLHKIGVEVVHQAQEAGADVVFDCTGRSDLFGLCTDIVRGECNEYAKPGRLCMQGFFPEPIPVDFAAAHRRRLTLTFPCGFDVSGTREALRLMSEGRLEIQSLVSHVWDVDQAPEAYSLMLEKPNDVMGMYVRW